MTGEGAGRVLRPEIGQSWVPTRSEHAEGHTAHPAMASCDQEVNERANVAPRKVREEVSKREIRNHFEPCDVQVSLPRRADEQSEVRSPGNNVPVSTSFDVETD